VTWQIVQIDALQRLNSASIKMRDFLSEALLGQVPINLRFGQITPTEVEECLANLGCTTGVASQEDGT
jgi:predicted YcjX-like family ATPase